jgi:phosphoserine aminotransferase
MIPSNRINAMKKPANIKFGSGPTRKVWNSESELSFVDYTAIGSSHRGEIGLAKISELLKKIRKILKIPDDYKIAILNGSGTGAMEFLLWNLLSSRTVDVFSAGIFGNHWRHDVKTEIKVPSYREFTAKFGESPDFSKYDGDNDCVFVWTETPSGTVVPNDNWIPTNRKGLSLCDATAGVFCTEIPWEKIDATAFSWQKGLGAEAGIATIVLSPRAIRRLEVSTPSWPIPRLLRIPMLLTKDRERRIDERFFCGHTINTISLLLLDDMLFSLDWAVSQGGLTGLIKNVKNNYFAVKHWLEKTRWANFYVMDEDVRAQNIAIIRIGQQNGVVADWTFLRSMAKFLATNGAALDVLNHGSSFPALRIWTGPVITSSDLELLFPWLETAYEFAGEEAAFSE